VVDEARVQRLLRAITDDLSVLGRESDADDGRRADPIWLRGVKYARQSASEMSSSTTKSRSTTISSLVA
jgi:hypothetical protein